MNPILQRAKELESEIIANRRYLHQHPEIRDELPNTTKFVMEKLTEMGYEPKEICKGGIVATVGNPGKVFLLRGDMDALPMEEDTDLEFRSCNSYAHTCGHDTHTAMLLGAAKILKEHEKELKGTVKLMFQPAEEIFTGAQAMIDAGVMENPHVDAALATHIASSGLPCGMISYKEGPSGASADMFTITIKGKGGHGAYPHAAVDPVNIGAHVVLTLQELVSREVNPVEPCVLTIGAIQAGDAGNILPESAVLRGSIRTFNNDVRNFIKQRTVELCEDTAKKFRAEAKVEFTSGVCPLINDGEFTREIVGYLGDLVPADKLCTREPEMGSEDFALVTQMVPATFLYLGAEVEDPAQVRRGHNPNVLFNEDCFHLGTAALAHCAIQWLDRHSN